MSMRSSLLSELNLLALAMGAYCRTQSKWMEQCKRNTNWKKEINHIHKLRTNNENIWKLNKSLSLLRDFTKSYSLKKLNLSLHRLKWGHKLLTKINGNDVIKNYLWKNSNSLSVNWTRKNPQVMMDSLEHFRGSFKITSLTY